MIDAQKIALVIHGLATGGAERVLARLANHWSEQGHEVTLITLDTLAADEVTLSPAVRRIALDAIGRSRTLWQAARNNRTRLRRLRQAIRDLRPNLVVSFTDRMNVLTLLACRRLDIPVIIAERSDPRHQSMGRLWEFLRRRTYSHCHALVVQTDAVAEHLRPLVPRRPIVVIPNGVADPRVGPLPARQALTNRLIAAGRLSHEKGFDLLIEAFARIAPRHPKWRLDIFGEGPQLAELLSQIERLNLTGQVRLAGRSKFLAREFANSALFALPSRYEGFPNALLEALACGLPAVAFNCESGPAEIVRNGIDGLLVPAGDIQAMSDRLDRLMSNPDLCMALAQHAPDVLRRFSEANFFRMWDEVLATTRCK